MNPQAPTQRPIDLRVRNTRSWIIDSFNGLFFKRPFDTINVSDIADNAGVGRSTFYEHFRNKEAVLRQSASGLLAILADAATDAGDADRIRCTLDHFLENRAAARTILESPSRLAIVRELSDLFEARLKTRSREFPASLAIPLRLAADHAAQSQLAFIEAWLECPDACSSADLATAIYRTTRGAVESLFASQT